MLLEHNQKSIEDNAEYVTEIPTTLKIIAKGEGFMAISASIDGSEYTGMLYKNDRFALLICHIPRLVVRIANVKTRRIIHKLE